MNFWQLKEQLAELLHIRIDEVEHIIRPNQYWSDKEIGSFINKAMKKFALDSKLTKKSKYLIKAADDSNAYPIPEDCFNFISVKYKGRPLDKVKIEFLETEYAGAANYMNKMGDGIPFSGNWSDIIGSPIHWYMNKGRINLFPRETASVPTPIDGQNPIRSYTTASTSMDSPWVHLPVKLPIYDINLVDVFVNGVEQHSGTYSIADNPYGMPYTSLLFNQPFNINGEVNVAYLTAPVVREKIVTAMIPNQTVYAIPTTTAEKNSAIRIVLNGDTQQFGYDYTFYIDNDKRVNITFLTEYVPVEGDSFELSVYNKAIPEGTVDQHGTQVVKDRNMQVYYYYSPADMIEWNDEPDIPFAYHDAIWNYAAFLALSREGQQTQDFPKARMFYDVYMDILKEARKASSEPINVTFEMRQPFFV